MNYISSKELSKKWGISQGRIIKLAREGRINGARKYGKTWFMPDDVQKPIDGRTTAGKELSCLFPENEVDNFRFPMYEFQVENSFSPPLSKDELALKHATEAFHACNFEKADEILGDLPDVAEDRYIRIAAIFTGCMIDLYCCNVKRFFSRFEKLKSEMKEDFPHKKEMVEYVHSIDANLGFNEYYVHEFVVDPDYDYHKTFLPRLINLSTVMFTFGIAKFPPSILCAHEINCMKLEKTFYPAELQSMDVFLGCAYASTGNKDCCDRHLKRAVDLAKKYDMYFNVSFHYCYMPEMFERVLAKYSNNFKEHFSRKCMDVFKRSARFTKAWRPEFFFNKLSTKDFVIFYYAAQGFSNREIARRLGVSIPTIANHLREIIPILGVDSKADLITMYEEHLRGL